MTINLNATLEQNAADWSSSLATLEGVAAALAAAATDAENRIAALEGVDPQPTIFLSNPSTARTVGPQVVADTGWQDLGDIFGTFAAESAVPGASGTLDHSGTLYLYCDKGDDSPNTGLRVNNIGNNRYKNFYYRSGGQWVIFTGAASTMDYGKPLLKEDKFSASYNNEEGIIEFFVNGVQAHRIVAADVIKALPGGPGRFGRYVKNGGADDMQTTLSSNGGAPLRILAIEPHFADRGLDLHISYTDSQAGPPAGHDARFPNGTVVPCTLTENVRPGRAKITVPGSSVPAQYAGKTTALTITQRDAPTVSLPTEYVVTDKTTWGMNVNGYPRVYNNLAAAGWRGDGYGKDAYGAANAPWIDRLTGDIQSFEPGVNEYMIKLDPVFTDSLVALTWDGGQGVTLNDPGKGASNIIRSANRLEFILKANAQSTYVSVPRSSWDASAPIRNIWCSEISASGAPHIDKSKWYAGFIESVSFWGFTRFMDYLGVNDYYTGFDDGVLTWANRRRAPLGLSPRHARIFIPTSSSTKRFGLAIRPYASHTFIAQYLPNRHWYRSKGNNWSITILAASGSGSITIDDQNVIITPPSSGTVQSVVDLMKATPAMVEIFDIIEYDSFPKPNPPLATIDTIPPMAKTNLRDGVDADPSKITFEDLAELFTRANLEPFVNINVNASTEYAVNAVQLVTDATGKVCRVEDGNEAFNLAFPGSLWYGAWAVYRRTQQTDILSRSIEESCYRAKIRFTALKQALGAKVRNGMGSMAVSPSITAQILNYPGMTKDIINAVFIAPYFYPLQDQADDALYVDGGYKSINSQMVTIAAHKAIAAPKGIDVETYEVGQHSTESSQTLQDRRQRSPEMKGMYGYYLSEIQRLHGFGRAVPFYHYHWISRISNSSSGAWGLIEYLGQPRTDAPKMDAYLDAYDGVFPPYIRYGASVRILGSRTVGQKVALDVPAAFNTRSYQIQWTLDGTAVQNATGWAFTLPAGSAGKKLGASLVLVGDRGYTKTIAYQDTMTISA